VQLDTSHAVERKGILKYLEHILEGRVPIKYVDPEKDLGDAAQDPSTYRLTNSGVILKYPDGQGANTYLER